MKFRNMTAALLLAAAAMPAAAGPTTISIFDHAVFYNGYSDFVTDEDLNDGILRHADYVYARPLTDDILDRLGEELTLEVRVTAACDTYDRLGNVTLALVPKGAASYVQDEVTRIELARFITPFMHKGRTPDTVPYTFPDNGLSMLLRDRSLRAAYDFWLELEIFGIPRTHSDCPIGDESFLGSLDIVTSAPAPASERNILVPVAMKKTEIFGPVNFNNYNAAATDTVGTTTKTWAFELPQDAADARIVLITSNHGSNVKIVGDDEIPGEEYARRRHLVYVDGEILLDYTPGGVSCEPYRIYNTEPNNIYGVEEEYEENMEFWLGASNWCPGAAIPMRYIELGALKAGRHELMLRVPDAQFVDSQGDFYVSAYVHGLSEGKLPAGAAELSADAGFTFSREGDVLGFTGPEAAEAAVYSFDGRLLYGTHRPGTSLDLSGFLPGVYIVSVRTTDGRASVCKFIIHNS